MTKTQIAKIIAKRDNLTLAEAKDIVDETQELINDALSTEDLWEIENILRDQLGLEMDYIDAFV